MTYTDQMVLLFTAKGQEQMSEALKKYKKESEDAAAAAAKLTKDVKSANPAFISFNQVIQDAPFGIRGVANNIQFLTQQFTQLRAGGMGTTEILKGMLANALTPMGGLMIGVSVATSLLTVAFGGMSKSAKVATEEMTTFADSLKYAEMNMADLTRAEQVKTFWTNEQEIFRLKERYRELSAETQKLAMSRSILGLIFAGGKDDQKAAINEQIKALTEFNEKISEVVGGGDRKAAKKKTPDSGLFFLDIEEREKVVMDALDKILPKMEERQIGVYERVYSFTKKADVEQLGQKIENEKIYAEFVKSQNKKIYLDNKLAIDTLDAGFMGVARGIEDSFTKAFQNAFGEANSLLEMFALAAGQQLLFSLAGMAIGGVGAGGILGAIFGGSTGKSGGAGVGISPVIGGNSRPIVINLQIGRKAMRAVVSDAQSENVRLRLT